MAWGHFIAIKASVSGCSSGTQDKWKRQMVKSTILYALRDSQRYTEAKGRET